MQERDARVVDAGTRLAVNQPHTRCFQLRQRRFDVVHGVGDVVQTFAALRQKRAERGSIARRHNQFQQRSANPPDCDSHMPFG